MISRVLVHAFLGQARSVAEASGVQLRPFRNLGFLNLGFRNL